MQSKVRIALPSDSDEIARILAGAFGPFEKLYTPEAFDATILDSKRICRRFEDKGRIWVATAEKEIVGTVSAVDENKELYIRSMAVLPRFQGKGIGQMLLDTVESYSTKHRFEYLFLYTTPFLAGAIRLYEENGFVRGKNDAFFGTPLLAMKKILNQKGNTTEDVIRS